MFELNQIRINPENPYPSKSDEEFKDLVSKIEKYPKFLKLRPIIYDPTTMMILGGNKRYAALIELGFKSVPKEYVKSADDLTEDEKRNFIYADNKNYGAYSMEFVDEDMAEEWGIEFGSDDYEDQDYSDKNKEIDVDSFEDSMTIKLNYPEDEYREVKEGLSKISQTPEAAVWKLLGFEQT